MKTMTVAAKSQEEAERRAGEMFPHHDIKVVKLGNIPAFPGSANYRIEAHESPQS